MREIMHFFRRILSPSNISIAAIVFSVGIVGTTAFLLLMAYKHENKQTIPVADAVDYVIFDEGIDIGDTIITFEPSRQFILEGKPRMVSPQAIIDFSGDKVTYSGDLPVDEAAKVFFDAVMGYVKEAKECKNESK